MKTAFDYIAHAVCGTFILAIIAAALIALGKRWRP